MSRYSAQHALAGVSPVLVVALRDAALVDALGGDDLPVLTLHAPLKSAPDEHREWRLAVRGPGRRSKRVAR